ncbi:Cysteine dioxygenase type 1, partial [Stegodyphus mimosarum]
MLDLRMVRKWRVDYDYLCQLVDQGNEKKRRIGSGWQPLFSELEACIWEWIAGRRAMALVVRRADIQKFALETAIEFDISTEEFKASSHWLDNFLKRYELSLRRSITLFKLEDNEVVKRALAFKLFVDGIDFSKYQLSNMIAMDETAVFLGQGAQTTVHHKASSSIYVPSTGYDSARVTCILAIRLDGKKVSPFLITKGKKDQIQRVSGIYVIESEKAWCTQAVIRKWVDFMLPPLLRGQNRGLLVWDSASTHRAKDMKNFLAERKIDQIMIPAGMPGYLQTLDIAINKPFKDHLQMEINEYIENRMMLDGSLHEIRFAWPPETEEGETREMEQIGETYLKTNDVAYINDTIGLHRMENPSHTATAASLHLYCPPFQSVLLFDQRTGHKTRGKVTFWSKYGKRTPFGASSAKLDEEDFENN